MPQHYLYTFENYSPQRNPLRSIVDITSAIKAIGDRRVADLGITWAQWIVLIRIASKVGSTAAELCRVIEYDSGSMTRMLDRLEKTGLIYRERSSEDRRVVNLHLTKEGQDLYPQLISVAINNLNQCLKGFTAEEIGTLMGFLDRIVANQKEPA
ncbi:MAG: MarR family transcriptional regulator [Desulfovibrio sp.]|uniref:MarR family winged helix-turn-helix transcriptional regulator n=1 Tax=Desulfovibrio sp. TaxID=885 RepID=UPI0039E3800D